MTLAENLEQIQRRIDDACRRAGHASDSVTLLAVAKTQPPEAVTAAADLGLTLFGENKVQEAKAKIPLCPGKLRWHFIGHLQSNKCRDAIELFDLVQSVDGLPLAQELNKRAGRLRAGNRRAGADQGETESAQRALPENEAEEDGPSALNL